VTNDEIAAVIAQVAAQWTVDGKTDDVGEALRRLRDAFATSVSAAVASVDPTQLA